MPSRAARRPGAAWLDLWSCRLGTTDKALLARTLPVVRNMESAGAHSRPLATLADARMRRLPHAGHFPRASAPLQTVHMDVFKVAAKDLPKRADGVAIGMPWALVCVDDFSRFVRVYFCRQKEDIPTLIRLFFEDMGARSLLGSHLLVHAGLRQSVHTDGGKELNSRRVADLLREFGVSANVTSAPDSPASNGLAESVLGVLSRSARGLLAMADLSGRYWQWAFLHAANGRNRLAIVRAAEPGGATSWRTPYELFFNKPPDMSHSVIFGAPCRVLHLGPELVRDGKMSSRTERGRVLAWCGDGVQLDGCIRLLLGYAVLLDSGRVVYSRNVHIDERPLLAAGHSPFAGHAAPAPDVVGIPVPVAAHAPFDDTPELRSPAFEDPAHNAAEHAPADRAQAPRGDGVASVPDAEAPPATPPASDVLTLVPSSDRPSVQPGFEPRATRSHAYVDPSASGPPPPQPPLPPADSPSFYICAARASPGDSAHGGGTSPGPCPADGHGLSPAAAVPGTPHLGGVTVSVPATLRAALASPHAAQWRAACRSHIEDLRRLDTYTERVVPASSRAIPSKWVFSVKTDASGVVTKFKARLVVQGFRQREGVDYDEVFAPSIRSEQVRLMLAMAAKRFGSTEPSARAAADPMLLSHLVLKGDVKDAYYTAPLPPSDRIDFSLPAGYEPTLRASPGMKVVAEAHKAMPGMKQAGRVWHHALRAVLARLDFVPFAGAPCVYSQTLAGGMLVIGHFVDDLLLLNFSSDFNALTRVKAALLDHFEVRFSDTLDKFLGVEFSVSPHGIRMHLHQYVRGIVAKFSRPEDRPAPTPERVLPNGGMEPSDESLLLRPGLKTYQELVGSLMFCMTTCRPDVAHAVHMLARRMSAPRVCDLEAAHRVLQYLRSTRSLGLLFRFITDDQHPGLAAYVDSDYAMDVERRYSTTGYVVLYNAVPVSWHSGLQPIIALSSTEAEYIALAECCRELVYLRQLLHDLQDPTVSRPTKIFEDNQGCIHLAKNPVHHKRTKHIDVRYHFIRSKQDSGEISIQKVHTDSNLADSLTKALPRNKFQPFRDAFMSSPA